jgi:hypothetical protein
MAACPITYCPPMSASGTAPDPQFFKLAMPVFATFGAQGEVRSTKLSFDDYNKMQSFGGKVQSWRKITPDWITDSNKFREVVCRSVERRAWIWNPDMTRTQQERIDIAQEKLNKQLAQKICTLDSLCERYLEAKLNGDPVAAKKFSRTIEQIDTTVAHLDRMAALVTACLFLSYRVGMNSVEVSAVLVCVKPPLVRQICYRARKLAEKIFSGAPQPR